MVVHLTEKGKTVQQPPLDYEEILGCLSQKELHQFGNYLERIIVAFRTQASVVREENAMDDWMEKTREVIGFALELAKLTQWRRAISWYKKNSGALIFMLRHSYLGIISVKLQICVLTPQPSSS
ncbi:MAG: hypothetical protein HFG58_07145 [Lachnospiraceae bacterium]|nr:hypothetical protein [Lachnospiraceae bacterium]